MLLPAQYHPDIKAATDARLAVREDEKRAARAAYKERKSASGVYAVRCAASGEVWVGQTRDLDKVWNRIVFTLRGGASPHRALQAAWNARGEAAFAFEALERLEEEALDFARQSALNGRTAHWRAALAAAAI
jgi:hypothetical protein